MSNKKPILLTGCTGTGKSKLAIELAKLNDSIIINADSMQVYRCLRILTSRPSDNDINKFPHALYGHIDCHKNYSVGAWLREIENLLNYAKDNNLRPIIVGGTGLYFSLLVNGLSNIPTISSHVRGAANQIKKNSPNKFVQDLKRFDPEALIDMDLSNKVRLQRAWEVYTQTGKSIRVWQKEYTQKPLLELSSVHPIILSCDRKLLDKRIELRFKRMSERGVINEIERIIYGKEIFSGEELIFRAIGFSEIKSHIRGDLTLEATETVVKLRTRQYAKRQRTWFKNQLKGWQKVSHDSNTNFEDLALEVANSIIP